jgi:peptide/nickel transport system substrate-binding protein
VEAADFAYLKLQLKRGTFDVALVGIAPRVDSDLSPLLHSRGALNHGAYANNTVDAHLDALRTAIAADDRRRAAQQLHRLLAEDPPFSILYAPVEIMVASKRVRGLANNGRAPRLAGLSLAPR